MFVHKILKKSMIEQVPGSFPTFKCTMATCADSSPCVRLRNRTTRNSLGQFFFPSFLLMFLACQKENVLFLQCTSFFLLTICRKRNFYLNYFFKFNVNRNVIMIPMTAMNDGRIEEIKAIHQFIISINLLIYFTDIVGHVLFRTLVLRQIFKLISLIKIYKKPSVL